MHLLSGKTTRERKAKPATLTPESPQAV